MIAATAKLSIGGRGYKPTVHFPREGKLLDLLLQLLDFGMFFEKSFSNIAFTASIANQAPRGLNC